MARPKPQIPLVPVSFTLPLPDREALERLAEARALPLTYIIRDFIRAGLARAKQEEDGHVG